MKTLNPSRLRGTWGPQAHTGNPRPQKTTPLNREDKQSTTVTEKTRGHIWEQQQHQGVKALRKNKRNRPGKTMPRQRKMLPNHLRPQPAVNTWGPAVQRRRRGRGGANNLPAVKEKDRQHPTEEIGANTSETTTIESQISNGNSQEEQAENAGPNLCSTDTAESKLPEYPGNPAVSQQRRTKEGRQEGRKEGKDEGNRSR